MCLPARFDMAGRGGVEQGHNTECIRDGLCTRHFWGVGWNNIHEIRPLSRGNLFKQSYVGESFHFSGGYLVRYWSCYDIQVCALHCKNIVF